MKTVTPALKSYIRGLLRGTRPRSVRREGDLYVVVARYRGIEVEGRGPSWETAAAMCRSGMGLQ